MCTWLAFIFSTKHYIGSIGDGRERVVHSHLHLVDLAGSERIKKTMEEVDGLFDTHDEVTRKE